MSVIDGQKADAATFNAAFVSKTANSTVVAVVDLNDTTDVNSGNEVPNAQRAINETFSTVGMTGVGDATAKNYSSTNYVANGDNRKVAIGKLDAGLTSVSSAISGKAIAPATSTDNSVPRMDGTNATQLQSSGVIVDDSNNVTGVNDLTVTGNLTVNGTTVTVNTTNLDVKDTNITVNKSGNDAASEGAGLTVDRTGTKGSLIYAAAATSKFKVGALGSEKEIATISDTQTLTNKTLTAPAITSPTGLVKGDVGLGNVDNTSDATKNAAVATLTNKTLTAPVINSPTGIVKGDVGLGNVDNTSDATKNAAAVTLTNKTLTSPVLTTPNADLVDFTGQGSTPSTPSSGHVKVYAKSADSKLYTLNSSGVETAVGSGSGGGAKNYLGNINNVNNNGDAETGALGNWVKGSIGALGNKLPTGSFSTTGFSANLILGIVSSGQLAGTYSFGYSSITASVAGDCMASPAFTIDLEDQAKVLSFKFAYKVLSGTVSMSGDSTNSFGVAILDVTNSTWIIPTGVFSMNQNAGVGIASGTFQTPSNGSQFRLVVYNANATSGAFSMSLDDFTVSPMGVATDGRVLCTTVNYAAQALGAASVTKLTTPTVTNDTTSSFDATAKRWNCPVAGYYCLIFSATNAGGTSSQLSSVLYVNGAAVDESDGIANATTQTASNTTVLPLRVGDYVELYAFTQSAANVSGKLRIFRLAGPTSGDEARVITARASKSADQTISTSAVKITGWATVADRAGLIDTTNNRFNISVAGDYEIKINCLLSAPVGFQLTGYMVNSSGVVYWMTDSSTADRKNGSALIPGLRPGDYVELYAIAGTSSTFKSDASTFWSIMRIAGPNAVSAQETINCRYGSSAATSLAANTNTLLPFATKLYDSHSLWTGTQFNVSTAGKYTVSAQMQLNSASLSNGQTVFIMIYKNGSLYSQGINTYGNGTAQYYMSLINDDVSCVPGDYIQIYGLCSVAATINATTATNFVTIKKSGN